MHNLMFYDRRYVNYEYVFILNIRFKVRLQICKNHYMRKRLTT